MSGDYINRETLRKLMYTEAFDRDTGLQRWDSGLWIRYKLFENCIDAIPAADVVEVVRCADCRYSDTFTPDCTEATFPLKCLGIRYGGVYPYWYCEHGKRKDGGQDDV